MPVCPRKRNGEEWQGSAHFSQGSPSRCAAFKFFSNTDMANLIGLAAAEVGFLVMKPFKKYPFLARGTKRGQTGNAPGCLLAVMSLLFVLFTGSVLFAYELDVSSCSARPEGPGVLAVSGLVISPSEESSTTYRARLVWDPEKDCFLVADLQRQYPLHRNITATFFWVGEKASDENGGIPNLASAWDEDWIGHYGGLDDPNNRSGYLPASFAPRENPFYAALPCNDLDENGNAKPEVRAVVYWADSSGKISDGNSILKDRWIKIMKGGRTAYAQWEDVGPFGEDDCNYVFGDNLPASRFNQQAGIDVSPAVRDYLGLDGIDKVDWQFVDQKDVPDGPWLTVVSPNKPNWYQPGKGITWQWQLNGAVNTGYDVDLYDVDLFETDKEIIKRLHDQGRKVICYFSAGTAEDWRNDFNKFHGEDLGRPLEEWEGERWLDIRSDNVRNIMLQRLDLAAEKGCDGVEPDNVDGFNNDTGFFLTASDQLDFNKFLAVNAHKKGLAAALKNDLEQAGELSNCFDFILLEECFHFQECSLARPFLDRGKPVLDVEYERQYIDDPYARRNLCKKAGNTGISLLILPLDLDDEFRISCQ